MSAVVFGKPGGAEATEKGRLSSEPGVTGLAPCKAASGDWLPSGPGLSSLGWEKSPLKFKLVSALARSSWVQGTMPV